MSGRRRAKVVLLATPPARPARGINEDLLTEALKDAFLLLIALDGRTD